MNAKALSRAPLVLSALLILVFALWGGLLRLQWPLAAPQADWISFHGPLMACGFFGILIGLERAVALRSPWTWTVPLLNALGAWTFALGGPEKTGTLLLFLGSLCYVGVCVRLYRLQPALYSLVSLAGALCWVGANGEWLAGRAFPQLALGWQAFLVLTIASERLELTRFTPLAPGRKKSFALASLLILSGAGLEALSPPAGIRLASAGFAALGFWLFFSDIARRTVRQQGLARFSAVCLLSGYFWLTVSGLVGLAAAPVESGFVYDAFLHSLFLGFVFSMVFGHAPIVLPAVMKIAVPYRPRFYFHWLLLQASLLARLAGDAMGSAAFRRWGALGNAAALALFFLSTFWAVRQGRQAKL